MRVQILQNNENRFCLFYVYCFVLLVFLFCFLRKDNLNKNFAATETKDRKEEKLFIFRHVLFFYSFRPPYLISKLMREREVTLSLKSVYFMRLLHFIISLSFFFYEFSFYIIQVHFLFVIFFFF